MSGANLFTPGPINIFTRFRASPGTNETLALYLGTCIQAPEPEAEFYNIPVMNDLSGRSVPFQIVQDGEKDMVILVMNRFDITVARRIRAIRNGGLGFGAGLGSESGYARGTLMLGISDFELILVNAYYGNPAAGTTPADLNPGRRYYSANCLKYKESTVGTRTLEIAMAMECNNIFNTSNRGFNLYTEDPANFGNLAPLT